MNAPAVTIDTSVWVSAAEDTDVHHAESVALLAEVMMRQGVAYVPAFARVEIACALSRRRRHAAEGRRMAKEGLAAVAAVEVAVDNALLDEAMENGTGAFLRGADALFAAAAVLTGSTLISWDDEHITRSGGISPTDWLANLPAPAP